MKKTIAIIHHTGDWGGGTKSLIDLCKMLKDKYRVVVCIPKGSQKLGNKIMENHCQTYEVNSVIPFTNLYSGQPPLISGVTLQSLRSLTKIDLFCREIESLKPDVVIFNTIVTAISARKLSQHIKRICIDRETMSNKISAFIYRCVLEKYLDAITFLSRYELDKLSFNSCMTAVFPDCVKIDAVQLNDTSKIRYTEKIPEDKFVVLYMGGTAKLKGPDVILEAFSKLDDRFLLLFAGECNEAKFRGRQLIKCLKYPGEFVFRLRMQKLLKNIGKNIVFTGLRDDIEPLILASDVIVFPATSVHQPRPCIEAGLFEKPVIISDYKETREFFLDGYNAITFKPSDSNSLRSKIEYCYNHWKEIRILGKNNRLMTENKHDFNDGKQTICTLIEKVCSGED